MQLGDPLITTDIMNLVGADSTRLVIPAFYKKVTEITKYFSQFSDYRYQILKIMNSKPALYMQRSAQGDVTDALWAYVQLQNEKAAKLKDFEPEDFEEDIAKDIVAGHIPLEKKQRISQDLEKQKTLLEKRRYSSQVEAEEKKAIGGVMSLPQLTKYEKSLKDLEALDKELSQFK